MKKTTFKVQFFDGRDYTWKPCTILTFTDLGEAKKNMRAQAEMCDFMVDFRIVEEVAA